jgi:glycosyltransferase involved in cell wall biosynthesis
LLFYIHFAVCLLHRLIQHRSEIYWAADFYALPLCFLAVKWHGAKLFYDSREIYTGMTGANHRPWLRKTIRFVEGILIRRTSVVFTTGPEDASHLTALYPIRRIAVLRNLPRIQHASRPVSFASCFNNSGVKKILLYQGILIRGRGIPACLKVLKTYSEGGLVLLGGGEHESEFREMANALGITDRVFFAGKVDQTKLLQYTAGADVGLALIDSISSNNMFALPNKLFEYIMAGLPVIVSDLPQMRTIVQKYKVGAVVPENDADAIVRVLRDWDKHPTTVKKLRSNCRKASAELNWETEFESIYPLFVHG